MTLLEHTLNTYVDAKHVKQSKTKNLRVNSSSAYSFSKPHDMKTKKNLKQKKFDVVYTKENTKRYDRVNLFTRKT